MARDFIQEIINSFKRTNCETLLDLGCGECSVTGDFKGSVHYTGIDLLDNDKAKQICNQFVTLDVKDALEHFGANSFDCVISLDVLEHFVKEESIKLLNDAERIARKLLCHFVPSDAFTERSKKQQYLLCGNKEIESFEKFEETHLQAHRCGWEKEEFEKLGYSVTYFSEPLRHWLAIKEIQ